MIGDIPFHIPDYYRAAVEAKELIRFGAVLKDSGTGQIVAHLQESGIGAKLLGGLNAVPFSPLDVLNLPSSLYANVQLGQLKTMVEGLQMLQYATLGATVAGIGVSAIGFALMNKKLNSIQGQISDLEKRMDEQFRQLHERELRARFSKISGLFERADQAHHLKGPYNEWQQVASALADESAFFKGEIIHYLDQPKFDSALFNSLVTSLTYCNSGRVECLMLSNELEAAHKVSTDIARHYTSLFDDLSPVQLANKASNPDAKWDHRSYHKQKYVHSEMKDLVQGLRGATEAVLTRPYLIETLIEKGIEGREYMTAIREEKERPLLLLAAE